MLFDAMWPNITLDVYGNNLVDKKLMHVTTRNVLIQI